MTKESFRESDIQEARAEGGFEALLAETKSLEDVSMLIQGSQSISSEQKSHSLHAVKVLRGRDPAERGHFLASEGYEALRKNFPAGLHEKLTELVGGASPRTAHDFGNSARLKDLDR